MHDQDLDDLAWIALCHHKLYLRALQAGNQDAAEAFVSESARSMPVLCRAAGIEDSAVMARTKAMLDVSRAPQSSVVH